MKILKKLTLYIFAAITMTSLSGCSTEEDITIDDITPTDSSEPHSCVLNLNVSKPSFEDDTRAASGWENGDKIYLTFTVGSGKSYGDAIYNNGVWNLNYYGNLTQGATAQCTAVYFDNPDYQSGSVITLGDDTGIYEDIQGTYIFSEGGLSVTAVLKPKTGRIRFTGTNNERITLSGISHYVSYDTSTGKYVKEDTAIKTQVETGTTPYIYGEFSDLDNPRLNIITSSSGYSKMMSKSIFKAGESGYMTIPTAASHSGWQNSVIFKVNGVEFTMIPVVSSSYSFLLAETETTTELYNAVKGLTASTSQVPKSNLSWDEWTTFLNSLSILTELEFRMPTEDEWQFAAKGGHKSQGYTYSGSNIVGNVAWYSGNSQNNVHEVKQLQPNELGFYDMSGNLWEVTSTNMGTLYYWCGGSYYNPATQCEITSTMQDYASYSVSKGGLRIALSID